MSISTADYLSEYDGLVPVDIITHAIRETEGVRQAGKSGGGMGGTMLNPLTYHELGFDSDLERRWVLQLMQRADVVHVQEQPIKTSFIDRHGDFHDTIWDLIITLIDGTRQLVNVKRLAVAESPGFIQDFKLMAGAVPAGVADKAWLATEYNLVPALVDRGDLYLRALASPPPIGAKAALDFIAAQSLPVPIATVCQHLCDISCPRDPDGYFDDLSADFWTVVWLLAKRKLRPVDDQFLDMQSEVLAV
jgi:hypothetical protein